MNQQQIMFKAPVYLIPSIIRGIEGDINRIILYSAAYLGCPAEEVNDRLACKGITTDDVLEYRQKLQMHPDDAYFYIERSIYWNLRYGKYNDDERMALAGCCAISSIIGEKTFTKTNNALLLSRMSGHTNIHYKTVADKKEQRMRKKITYVRKGKKRETKVEQVPYMCTISTKKIPELNPDVKAISSRRKLDKLKSNMFEWFGAVTYGHHTRGFYCSLKLSLQQLIRAVEDKKDCNLNKETELQRLTRIIREGMTKKELQI